MTTLSQQQMELNTNSCTLLVGDSGKNFLLLLTERICTKSPILERYYKRDFLKTYLQDW